MAQTKHWQLSKRLSMRCWHLVPVKWSWILDTTGYISGLHFFKLKTHSEDPDFTARDKVRPRCGLFSAHCSHLGEKRLSRLLELICIDLGSRYIQRQIDFRRYKLFFLCFWVSHTHFSHDFTHYRSNILGKEGVGPTYIQTGSSLQCCVEHILKVESVQPCSGGA